MCISDFIFLSICGKCIWNKRDFYFISFWTNLVKVFYVCKLDCITAALSPGFSLSIIFYMWNTCFKYGIIWNKSSKTFKMGTQFSTLLPSCPLILCHWNILSWQFLCKVESSLVTKWPVERHMLGHWWIMEILRKRNLLNYLPPIKNEVPFIFHCLKNTSLCFSSYFFTLYCSGGRYEEQCHNHL